MQPFRDMCVDYVGFYVDDIAAQAAWLAGSYGFTVCAATDPSADAAAGRSAGLSKNQIKLVLTQPLTSDHPGAVYVGKHGDGVADIGLRVPDAAAAFREAVRHGARPVATPAESGGVVTAKIAAFGDVVHTFVQRPDRTHERVFPGLLPVAGTAPSLESGLAAIDHFAVCVEAGQLDSLVEFYEQALDFKMIFIEHIVVGSQAMNSKVVQSGSGAVTLTLIEPDLSRAPGQIDQFLNNHGGCGVQHVAFSADDIVRSVDSISATGVEFLSTPAAYYSLLADRLDPDRHSIHDLQMRNVLADEDQDGQLFQIFTRSVHPRKTFFIEIIERFGARTFGSKNVKALYEAVELQRRLEGSPV
jgi:4-hydroxymandelate synthase